MITLDTESPAALLKNIKKAIDDGKVKTWRYDKAGDFTHTADQYDGQVWLRPSIEAQELIFKVKNADGIPLTFALTGIIQGRFCEVLITHFYKEYECIEILPPTAN